MALGCRTCRAGLKAVQDLQSLHEHLALAALTIIKVFHSFSGIHKICLSIFSE